MAKEYEVKVLKNGEKRYVFDVNLGYDTNGKRVRRTITSKTIKEGRKKVSELRIGHRQLQNRTLSFGEAFELYIADCKYKVDIKQMSPITLKNKIAYSKHYSYFNALKLEKISDVDIERWSTSLNSLKPQSKNKIENELSTFFSWCKRKRIIQENPFVFIEKTKFDKKEINFLTEKEFINFISYVDDTEFRLLLTTIFYTGLRFSEVMGLKNNDIVGYELHLSETRKGSNLQPSKKFKNKSSKRIVPFPLWLEFPKKEKYIFDQYTSSNMYHIKLAEYISKSCYPHFTFHDLRHSYASMMLSKKIDMFVLSNLMGHTNIGTTINTYGHLYEENRKNISNMFGVSTPKNILGVNGSEKSSKSLN